MLVVFHKGCFGKSCSPVIQLDTFGMFCKIREPAFVASCWMLCPERLLMAEANATQTATSLVCLCDISTNIQKAHLIYSTERKDKKMREPQACSAII